MTVLICGGAKSGKSDLAQRIAVSLAKGGRHYYVATMIPMDGEDRNRIRRHLKQREGMGFETIECGRNLLTCLDGADTDAVFLLDSVTALLTNELFPDGCGMNMDNARRCAQEVVRFAASVANAVIVSDYIFSDAICYDETTEAFRKCLADISRALAAVSDTVIEATAGNILVHKGALPI